MKFQMNFINNLMKLKGKLIRKIIDKNENNK